MHVKLIIVFKRLQLAPFLLAPSFVENSSELDLGDIFYGDHIFGDIWEIIKVSDDKIGRAIYPRYQDTQLPSPLPQWGKEPSYAKPISSEVKSEVTCRSNIEQVRIVQFCSFFKITVKSRTSTHTQRCLSCGILVSGIRARGVSLEHMENMEMFSCSPT